ncbi:MAG: lysophospholipid acyltransferase family protein, partial [Phycisphaeraceae bacterium]
MARNPGPFVAWSQYLAARTAAATLTAFDVEANLRAAAQLGRALHAIDGRHRDRARHSIALSFPEWDAATVNHVTERSFQHFVQLAVEVLHTPRTINLATWSHHLKLNDLARAIEVLNRGQGAVMVTGHLGNWEVLGYSMALLGYDVDAIARPIDNPLINDWLLGIRQRRGMRIITKWNATDRMMRVLREGGALGFIADQNAGSKGMFVPFFGRLASTYKSIGLLAMRKQVPIVCGFAHRIGTGYRYEIGVADVIEPSDWADRRDPLFYITARYSRAIESMIRAHPQQYLWMHRRWKSRPRHEREGKPMPASLRRNLEDLPWMTDDLMKRLEIPPPP